VKNVSESDITNFSGAPGADVSGVTLKLSANPPVGGGDGIQLANSGTNMVRSYVTFPGISMHPEMATAYDSSVPRELTVSGKTPHTIASEDVLDRNVIRSYHDMFLVKAGLAYVDNNGTFCLYDIYDDVFDTGNPLPLASAADAAVDMLYRVEGIKAVRFEQETGADGRVTGINVHVLAEGDNAITGRTSTSFAVQQLRDRWPGITWNDEMYYEDFEMRWRTRNIEAPTP
jgi:hypothetical protein